MIRNGLKSTSILFFTLTLLLSFGSAHAAFVTVSNVMDIDGSAINFDPATTSAGGTSTITIGFAAAGFIADSTAINTVATASDTLSMTVTAAPGFVITGVRYFESGGGETGAGGVANAQGGMVVDGLPAGFGMFTYLPNGGGDWDINSLIIPVANKTEIQLSATNTLIAFLFGVGPATIFKDEARFEVTLAPVPLPPAVWLSGSALVGLVSIGARRHYSA